nr:hypothetical protein [uncultured bacterium]
MVLELTTPALLFSAISLLLLAYGNRFLALATLIRDLHARYQQRPQPQLKGQLENLRRRIILIRNMQFLGVSSFFLCVLCMALLFWQVQVLAQVVFAFSLLLLMASLALSIWEIQISVGALHYQLEDLGQESG